MNKLITSTAVPTRELKLEAIANISASFELLCLASGMEALGEMMEHDAQAICGPRTRSFPAGAPLGKSEGQDRLPRRQYRDRASSVESREARSPYPRRPRTAHLCPPGCKEYQSDDFAEFRAPSNLTHQSPQGKSTRENFNSQIAAVFASVSDHEQIHESMNWSGLQALPVTAKFQDGICVSGRYPAA